MNEQLDIRVARNPAHPFAGKLEQAIASLDTATAQVANACELTEDIDIKMALGGIYEEIAELSAQLGRIKNAPEIPLFSPMGLDAIEAD